MFLLRYFSSSRQPVPTVILLLPGTITTLAVDTNSVCDSCQALQTEREGETHQHTGIVEEHNERYFDQTEELQKRKLPQQSLRVHQKVTNNYNHHTHHLHSVWS